MTPFVSHPHDHKRNTDWAIFFRFVDRFIPPSSSLAILDLGAGTGNIAVHYAASGASSVALDIDSDLLAGVRARDLRIRIIRHDLNGPLPFPDFSFDAVFCIGTLPYASIADPGSVFREIARVTRRYAIIDFFPRFSPYRFFESFLFPRYSPRRFSRPQALRFAARHGLFPVAACALRGIPFFSRLLPFSGKAAILIFERK